MKPKQMFPPELLVVLVPVEPVPVWLPIELVESANVTLMKTVLLSTLPANATAAVVEHKPTTKAGGTGDPDVKLLNETPWADKPGTEQALSA